MSFSKRSSYKEKHALGHAFMQFQSVFAGLTIVILIAEAVLVVTAAEVVQVMLGRCRHCSN